MREVAAPTAIFANLASKMTDRAQDASYRAIAATSGLADLGKVAWDRILLLLQSVWRQLALKRDFQISAFHSLISAFVIAKILIFS